jgi:ATP-dependent DNA helicase PIF1
MQLNEKQQYAFEEILKGRNIFISGPGGVGKSVLVNKIRDMFEDDTIFIAPTGIAAQNIKGSTIHRTFKFPLGFLGAAQRKKVSDKVKELFEDGSITRIVIDEISMVRGDLFTAIDDALRRIKKRNIPFGGIQIIVVGDFFQLPPVINNRSVEAEYYYTEFKSPYAFDTDSWREAGFQTIELDKIMRQDDEKFIGALNSIRQKDENYETSLKFLNSIGRANDSIIEETLFLCSTNADAALVNEHNYDDIAGPEKVYYATKTGSFKDYPVPDELRLKVGVKVLICANDANEQYFNGQTGYITNMTNNGVFVELSTGQIVNIEKFTWQEFEYFNGPNGVQCKPVGTFSQLPLKLGYAVTIHKSQGLSLDGCFSHGQAYVAFSRLRTLEGLSLMADIGRNEIIVDGKVKEFYNTNKFSNLMNMSG